jgi:hypothetical protein
MNLNSCNCPKTETIVRTDLTNSVVRETDHDHGHERTSTLTMSSKIYLSVILSSHSRGLKDRDALSPLDRRLGGPYSCSRHGDPVGNQTLVVQPVVTQWVNPNDKKFQHKFNGKLCLGLGFGEPHIGQPLLP